MFNGHSLPILINENDEVLVYYNKISVRKNNPYQN
jgi:hypothetical protein